MSSHSQQRPDDEIALAELAALRAGELTADEEARLRVRMAEDPEVKNQLWALDNVHRLFEKPSPAAGAFPADMPYDVAARLQARITEEALQRHEPSRVDDPDRKPAPEQVARDDRRSHDGGPEAASPSDE